MHSRFYHSNSNCIVSSIYSQSLKHLAMELLSSSQERELFLAPVDSMKQRIQLFNCEFDYIIKWHHEVLGNVSWQIFATFCYPKISQTDSTGVELVSCQASFSLGVLRLPSSFLELGAPLPTCQWDDMTCLACFFRSQNRFNTWFVMFLCSISAWDDGFWKEYPKIYIKIGKCLPSTATWQVMSCVKHGNQGKGDLLIRQSSKRRVPTVPVDVVQRLGLSQLHFAASQCPAAKVFCLRELHIFGSLWCSHRHKNQFKEFNIIDLDIYLWQHQTGFIQFLWKLETMCKQRIKSERQEFPAALWCLVNLPSQLQDVCQTTVAQQSPRMRAAKLLFSLLSSELNNNRVSLSTCYNLTFIQSSRHVSHGCCAGFLEYDETMP